MGSLPGLPPILDPTIIESRRKSIEEEELPRHWVELSPFFLALHETTQGQYVRAFGSNPSRYSPGDPHCLGLSHPVERVSWQQARDCCHVFDLELPTEAQWEYAAKANSDWLYPNSRDGADLQTNIADLYAETFSSSSGWSWDSQFDDGFIRHAPVGSYRPNPWGLFDLGGNVMEWCLDRYGSYETEKRPGTGEHLSFSHARSIRSNCFVNNRNNCRSTARLNSPPNVRRADIGFRFARQLRTPASPSKGSR